MSETQQGFERWIAAPDGQVVLPWLEDQRTRAIDQVRARALPTTKDEAWRYTSLNRLVEQGFSRIDESSATPRLEDFDGLSIEGLDSLRIVLVNGRHDPGLSRIEGLPAGVRIGSLRSLLASDPDAVRDHLNRLVGAEPSLFAALNTAGLDDGLVVLLAPGARLEQPLEVIHLAVGLDEPRVAQPRHLVVLEEGAHCTLIERYLGLDTSLYCTNSLLEVAIGAQARLEHARVQLESPSAFHIAGLYVSQGAHSHYRGISASLGAAWSRTDIQVRFHGEHAECDLQGLYLAGDRQLVDFHLDVEHGLPNCVSRENFKGILHGKGRAVFDGRVLVVKDAQKTDAAMSNRNLMLSEQAEVDAKPQLEIHADDVKCSHGTTVGQLEPEMLFYLRSRGLSAAMARRMLCLGFAEEVLDALPHEALRAHLSAQVGERLETAVLDG